MLKRCDNCNRLVPPDARTCPTCGAPRPDIHGVFRKEVFAAVLGTAVLLLLAFCSKNYG
ncbi:hypothetical protein GGQ74_000880 [Desulfobaculum xiamenense]|uniref:Zinc-ribbon domain-containing protein n=1 Tax=Desulfobaculum xiamenense TaxID=995050 RepID=A0A846QJJ2_9BACT|nr:zinc-ribbon domain-containing protein [Desulfobaculum xiamenense]NJB67240.1 hypothetical protein [Desulfobaculum xiamenense]